MSRFDERPEVKSLPRVGGFVDPSVEAVVALKPDLVLVQPGPPKFACVSSTPESIDATFTLLPVLLKLPHACGTFMNGPPTALAGL